MAKKKKNAGESVEEQKSIPRQAVLFELENLAIKGRQLVYDVLKKALADKNVELNMNMFSRYCSQPSAKYFLPLMMKMDAKAKAPEPKLITDITDAINNVFVSSSLKLDSGLAKLLKVMQEQNAVIAALSSLNDETAKRLAANLELVDRGITLLSYPSHEKNFPSADAWLKLAKKISVPPSSCVVIASSSVSCKAALSAGMRSVVVPDKYTSCQDFGGADFVFDNFDNEAIGHIIELMKAD